MIAWCLTMKIFPAVLAYGLLDNLKYIHKYIFRQILVNKCFTLGLQTKCLEKKGSFLSSHHLNCQLLEKLINYKPDNLMLWAGNIQTSFRIATNCFLKQTSTLPPSFSLVTLQHPSGTLFYIYGVIVNYLEYLTMMVDDELGLHQDDDDKDSW